MAIVVQYLPANARQIIMISFLLISLSGAFVSNAVKFKLKKGRLKVISITLILTATIESLVVSFREHLVILLRITRSVTKKRLIILHFFSAVMYLFISYTFLYRRKIMTYYSA